MGKKQKREARRNQRLDKAFKVSLGAVTRNCKCGKVVQILPLDSWAYCSCGGTVRR